MAERIEFEKLCDKVDRLADLMTQFIAPQKSRYTLKEWFFIWLEDSREKGRIKDGTYKDYVSKYKTHIDPKLGAYNLMSLTGEIIEVALNQIEFGRTREKCLSILTTVFNRAVIVGEIDKNPCLSVELKKFEPIVRLPLSPEETKKFRDAIEDYPTGLQFRVYLETGIRKEEISNLELCAEKKPFLKVHGTKSESADREVPITKELANALKEFYKNGGKFSIYNTSRRLEKICKRAKIRRIGAHHLRHTFATTCYYANVPIERISYWLGHSSIRMTESYIHQLIGLKPIDHNLINKVF